MKKLKLKIKSNENKVKYSARYKANDWNALKEQVEKGRK